MIPSRVAIVHERFTELGGSEQVVRELAELWPEADIRAPIVDRDVVGAAGLEGRVVTGPLQPLYRGNGRYTQLFPVLPWAMGKIDLGDVDLVVVSHHAFANRVRPPADVPIVSYTHTPARWMWDRESTQREVGGLPGRGLLTAFSATQRRADRAAAQRLTGIIANSTAVAARVHDWWGRDSIVVPPPVDTSFFTPDDTVEREDFFLVAGRLVPYKRADRAVAAAEAAGHRIVVAGDGRFRSACESVAGPGTEFLGAMTREQLRDLYRRCRALVFPGIEDFGMVPVEAQACGAPVLAVGAGGVLDSVLDEQTGHLIRNGDDRHILDQLSEAMTDVEFERIDPSACRANAERFSIPRFHRAVTCAVGQLLESGSVSAAQQAESVLEREAELEVDAHGRGAR